MAIHGNSPLDPRTGVAQMKPPGKTAGFGVLSIYQAGAILGVYIFDPPAGDRENMAPTWAAAASFLLEWVTRVGWI